MDKFLATYQRVQQARAYAASVSSSTLLSSIAERIAELDSDSPDGVSATGQPGELQRLNDLRARLLGGKDQAGVLWEGEI